MTEDLETRRAIAAAVVDELGTRMICRCGATAALIAERCTGGPCTGRAKVETAALRARVKAALDPLLRAHVAGQTPRMVAENEFVSVLIDWMEDNTDFSRYDS